MPKNTSGARPPAISQQCGMEVFTQRSSRLQSALSPHIIEHVTRWCATTPSDDTLWISKLCMLSDPSVHQLLPCRTLSGAAPDWLFARRRREISRGAGQGDNTDKRGHDLCVCGRATTRSIKARCIVAEHREDARRSVVRLAGCCTASSFVRPCYPPLRCLSHCNNTAKSSSAAHCHQHQLAMVFIIFISII